MLLPNQRAFVKASHRSERPTIIRY